MKSSQGPVRRICQIRPGTTSVTTKEKCQIDHGVWDTLKAYLKAHIIHSHGPTAGFWGARGKCGALVKKGKDLWHQKCCYNKLIMDLFLGGGEEKMKRRDDNWMVKPAFYFSFQNCPFWTYVKRINTFTFWYILWIHIRVTTSEGPKSFVNCFLWKKNSNHGRY